MELLVILKFLFLFLFSFTSVSAVPSSSQYIIATASTGGTFYPIGVSIATLLSMKMSEKDNMSFSAISSDGSFDNIKLLRKKEVHFAIVQGLAGMMAWEGTHLFKDKPQKELRSISMLWKNVEHFMVKKTFAPTGNIHDLKNLYGENFSIAENNSGSKVSAEILMDALGIDYRKMHLQYLGYNQSSVALKQGKIDGMNTPAGAPVSAVSSVYNDLGPLKVTLLEFSDEDLYIIQKEYPIWSRYIIKAHTYPRQTKDIHTIAQPNLIVTHVDTPEEVVYLLIKTMYENLSFLNSVNKGTLSLSLENGIDGLNIPLHKGAIRFYQEMGIKIPAHLHSITP